MIPTLDYLVFLALAATGCQSAALFGKLGALNKVSDALSGSGSLAGGTGMLGASKMVPNSASGFGSLAGGTSMPGASNINPFSASASGSGTAAGGGASMLGGGGSASMLGGGGASMLGGGGASMLGGGGGASMLGAPASGSGSSTGGTSSTLGTYNVDPSSVSVSGLSAGGFMAAQLGVAYSDVFKIGFGVFAGGPFDCARSSPYFSCMYNGHPSITQPTANMKAWSGNQIAPVSNLAQRKIYMQVGSADTTVGPNVMAQLKAQLATFSEPAMTTYVTTSGAAHTFPTDFDGAGDSTCGISMSPYVSNCQYDGAGAVLKWMYGDMKARNMGTATGSIVPYAQTGKFGAAGMDTTGYLYVPKACAAGASGVCKLHVVMHGCLQSYSQIGNKFITNSGYTKWADTNNVLVLFPQAVVDNSMHTVWSGMPLPNPNGCFDWVGWYGTNADQIGGVQLVAVINAVKQITGGFKGSSNMTA